MLKYAVIGNPIEHSRSPQIHTLFAEQFGIELRYERILAALDEFANSLDDFIAAGGKGVNVTVPFKQEAWQRCQMHSNQCSDAAKKAGAVNTIGVQTDGALYGDNTDGIGLVCDIEQNINIEFAHKKVLLLGAGGAVRGVIEPIVKAKCTHLHIANRTEEKAQALTQLFQHTHVTASSLTNIPDGEYDIIINATSASIGGQVPEIDGTLLARASLVYDMMYDARDTAFIAFAKQQGAKRCFDGLGMLVEQAAHAFALWHGVMPNSKKVIQTLRASL